VTPAISVVIPTHDRKTLLAETISSVLAQTETEWELIVVDDASTDGTSSYLGGLGHSKIRVLGLPKNVGQSAARQEGTQIAASPFVLFLDDDDLLRPNALDKLHRSLAKEPDAVAAVGANVEFDARGHKRRIRHPYRHVTRVVWPELLWGWSATPSRVLVRRDAFERAGGWDPAIDTAHDTELWLRMSLLGPFVLDPQVVVDKRAHEGQSRPEDQRSIQHRFRQRWFENLPAGLQSDAERVMKARERTLAGEDLYRQGDMSAARREFMRALTAAPILLSSPIARPYLVRDVAKATVTSAADAVWGAERTARVRGATKKISQTILRRDPGGARVMKRRDPRPPNEEG
jgi:glycosyltransferase involved in cell wall biosynthesis